MDRSATSRSCLHCADRPLARAAVDRRSRRAFLKGIASAVVAAGPGSLLISACGGGGASTYTAATPRLASVANFRDIGGAAAGYPTIDGKTVRRGFLYRSSALTLDAADRGRLDALGVSVVYDLRTPSEVVRDADVLPIGATYKTINVTGALDAMALSFDSVAQAVAAMERAQRENVVGSAERAGFGALLTQIALTPGAQIVHSNMGKDRTGWAAALLLTIANVPFDIILQDYLLSNVYAAASIHAHAAQVALLSGSVAAQAAAPALGVQASFLNAAFDQVHTSYGTMTAYLTEGLNLNQGVIDRLYVRLVV